MLDKNPGDHNQTNFQKLIIEAQDEAKAFNADNTRSLKSLYRSLEKAYLIKKRAEEEPELFKDFAKAFYKENEWGRITNATMGNPFTIPIRLTFAKINPEQATISRYAKALKHLEETQPDVDATPGKVASLLEEAGGVEELVASGRNANKATADDDQSALLANQKAVLRNRPLGQFVLGGAPGFRLLLAQVDDQGTARVLGELPDGDVNDAIGKVSADRYKRLSPIPYIGSKHKQLRLLDAWLPPDITEYREPFIGGGAVFLFIRNTRSDQNIRYWINDLAGDLYRFWCQIQADPEPMLKQATRIFQSATDLAKANDIKAHLYPDRKSTDALTASVAYLVTKLWTYGHKDEMSPVHASKFVAGHSFQDLFQRIREVHPLLDGVRITNQSYKELLVEPPQEGIGNDGVFVFLDPPYDDMEQVYRNRLGETDGAPVNRTKEGRKGAHWDLALDAIQCPYRWLMTHSNTDFFRSRAVLMKHSAPSGAKFYEHQVHSGLRNCTVKEALLTNFKPNDSAQGIDRPPIDWVEVVRQIYAGEGEPIPSVSET